MENQRNNGHVTRPSVGYLLFQYQSELTRKNAEPTRLSRTKIHIIDGLVSRTICQLRNCSVEELQACKRELLYKEQLRAELHTMRRRTTSTSRRKFASSAATAISSTRQTTIPVVRAKPSAPSTPPKPKPVTKMSIIPTKVSIYGPEIFV